MATHNHAPRQCPHCGHILTGSTGVGNNDTPAVGDLSLCIFCEGLFMFTMTGTAAILEKDIPEHAREHVETARVAIRLYRAREKRESERN